MLINLMCERVWCARAGGGVRVPVEHDVGDESSKSYQLRNTSKQTKKKSEGGMRKKSEPQHARAHTHIRACCVYGYNRELLTIMNTGKANFTASLQHALTMFASFVFL